MEKQDTVMQQQPVENRGAFSVQVFPTCQQVDIKIGSVQGAKYENYFVAEVNKFSEAQFKEL